MKRYVLPSVAVAAALISGLLAVAQDTPTKRSGQVEQRPPSTYQKMAAEGPGGPAPVHDMTGFWNGPLEPKFGETPSLTAFGESKFKKNIPDPFSAHSNDPWRVCDPFGFPRSATNETRGLAFAPMPEGIVIMTQYQKIWRMVWMDGRELPKNVGTRGGSSSRWYGYSIGHWDGDNTLVVETTGVDDSTWIDRRGYPHSVDMHVTERYTRVDRNDLELSVTIDDPKMYTKPFLEVTNKFKFTPKQLEDEQLCVPSQAIDYLNTIAIPAGQDEVGQK
ncbi:MAG TPA: hypothetical protein VFB23_14745 [Candidatus Acidoferrales bacterium]|jgi:hypothetical protein|nr:hypothetical protein [Candidatus Acidoferrales bacterium]